MQWKNKYVVPWALISLAMALQINTNGAIIKRQEAMENFVFPNEITTKLLKMSK